MNSRDCKLHIRAVPQPDGFSCGYYALSAVYTYYGLSRRDLNLRALLGTDHVAPYGLPDEMRRPIAARFPDMKGTMPFDIFAVLYRHGFKTRIAPSDYVKFRREFRLNLLRGHPAVALVDGGLHWVVVSGVDSDGVWIVDSIGERGRRVYRLNDDEYQKRRTGEILVSRRKNAGERQMTYADFARECLRATWFCARAMGSMAGSAMGRLFRT